MKLSPLVTFAAMATLPIALLSGQDSSSRASITGVSHLSVYTSDQAKADHFYIHDLGGVKRSDPESPAGVRYYFSPTQFVEVLPLPSSQPSPINRLDHVAFNTVDAEKLRQYLAANKVAVPAQVTKGSDGSSWFQVKDPEGHRVEFVQPPPAPEAVPENPLSVHIIHVGFIVQDRTIEDAFFLKVLGFRPYWFGGRNGKTEWISQQVPDGPDWLEYMVVGGPEAKAITQENAGVLNHFSLGVFNMEKSVNLLYAGDRLTAKHSPPQIGLDGKWQLNLYDPDGTRAEVMEFQPSVKPCCSDFTASSPTK